MFTGNKETDKIVLAQLDDYDLGSACATNKHLNEICKDETFWRNRTLSRFGPYLGNAEQIKEYMNTYGFDTWKKYYISLIDFLEKVYDGSISVKLARKDLRILNKTIEENNLKMEKDIVEFVEEKLNDGTWHDDFGLLQEFLEKQLERDMINPNVLFTASYLEEERIGEQIKFLLKSKDKRIRPEYKNYEVLKHFADNHDYEYDDGKEIFKLLIDDRRIDPNVLFDYDVSYIVEEYLPILAKSTRIDHKHYPKLLKLLVNVEREKDDILKEGFVPTFKQYATRKLKNILAKLE